LKAGGRNKKTKRTAPKSENVYLKLLVKVCSRKPLQDVPISEGDQSSISVLGAIDPFSLD
jgi:hypothetical protein